MKLYLALVGTLCLVSGIRAAGSLTETVAGTVTASLAGFNAAVNTINNTITEADTHIQSTWTNWYDDLINRYTSLVNRFQQNNMLDISGITSGLSDLYNERNYSIKALLKDDLTYDGAIRFTDVAYQMASQIGDILNAAAVEMTSQTVPTNACLNQHGAKLTTSPITIDRVTDCILAENDMIVRIGANVATHIGADTALAPPLFDLLKICKIPDPSDTNAMTGCINQYLGRLNNMKSFRLQNSIDSLRYQQTQMLTFRANRCVRLVQSDIQDAVEKVKADFNNCLSSSS